MRRGRKERVPFPTATAFRDYGFLTILQNFGKNFTGGRVADYCTRRNGKHDIFARVSGFVRSHSMLTALRDPPVPVRVVEQRREIRVSANDDVTAAAAVAAIRPAHWNAMLATKRRASRSAGACFDVNGYSINEHSRAPESRE
jgi:hypothetical protein